MIQSPEVIAQPIELTPITDPQPGTAAYEYAERRDESSRSFAVMPWLPQLPDDEAQTIHARIDEYERKFAAPNRQLAEYTVGTACVPDEIAVIEGLSDGGILYTAEHATGARRADKTKTDFPDAGTAGLVALLAEDQGVGLIMRGRQTGNAATDPDHPIKVRINEYLPRVSGFMSVHGMGPGKFVRLDDTSEIQVCLGLGMNPSEAMISLAERIIVIAHGLGLYAVKSNCQDYYIQKQGSTELKRLEDGSPKTNRLGALKPNSTVNYVKRQLVMLERPRPVLQVELTNLLRLTSSDNSKKDKVAEIIGTAMGYRFLRDVSRLILSESVITP
jgi:hypothetical protein